MTHPQPAPSPGYIGPGLHIPSQVEKDVNLKIDSIRVDGGTQTRANINMEVVEEYAERMKAGDTFPRVVVFREKEKGETWMADGFHRLLAAKVAHLPTIPATIKQGTQRDALLYSLGANSQHGLRRTNADKRQAVKIMLDDPEWAKWSNEEIARRCGVSAHFVGDVRGVSLIKSEMAERTVERDGKTYEMKVEKIGKLRGLINAPDPLRAQREMFPAEQKEEPSTEPRRVPLAGARGDDEEFERARDEENRRLTAGKRQEFHARCPQCGCHLYSYEPLHITRGVAEARS